MGTYVCVVPTLEEITYEAGRAELADQESVVAGIRQRTGMRLAAHALVAPFLGATAVHARGLHLWGWVALAMLVAGLVVSAMLLAPWRLKFAVDAVDLYTALYPQAAAEADPDTLGWLASAGFGYQNLRAIYHHQVQIMSALSGLLGVLMVFQTLAWIAALAIH
jgi:hypothetical protein